MGYSMINDRPSPKWYAQGLLHDLNINSVPIDAIGIANKLGIRCIEKDLEDEADGSLVREGNKSLMVINSRITNDARKNFTIAHELGHYYIKHHNEDQYTCSSSDMQLFDISNKEIEAEANCFAAELLMPEKLILSELKFKDFNYETIEYISSKFKVSREAAAIKIIEKSVEKDAVVITRNGGILWSKSSRYFKYTLRNRIHKDTYLYDAVYDNKELPNQFEQVYPHSWLIDMNIPDDLNIQEHTIYFNKYNSAITLIKILPNNEEDEIMEDYEY